MFLYIYIKKRLIVINVKFHMDILLSVIVLHFWLVPEVLIKQSE